MPTFEQIETEIAGMLTVPDEELTEEQRAVMDDYLDELAGQEAQKVDGFGRFVKMQTAFAEAYKKEGQRLLSKAKSAEARLAYLKARYLEIMQGHGLRKVNGDAYTLSVRESEVVSITQRFEDLPEAYLRRKTTLEPDKTAIKAALKAGTAIPGCDLVRVYNLQIR